LTGQSFAVSTFSAHLNPAWQWVSAAHIVLQAVVQTGDVTEAAGGSATHLRAPTLNTPIPGSPLQSVVLLQET
jgi:hypothetical protein